MSKMIKYAIDATRMPQELGGFLVAVGALRIWTIFCCKMVIFH